MAGQVASSKRSARRMVVPSAIEVDLPRATGILARWAGSITPTAVLSKLLDYRTKSDEPAVQTLSREKPRLIRLLP